MSLRLDLKRGFTSVSASIFMRSLLCEFQESLLVNQYLYVTINVENGTSLSIYNEILTENILKYLRCLPRILTLCALLHQTSSTPGYIYKQPNWQCGLRSSKLFLASRTRDALMHTECFAFPESTYAHNVLFITDDIAVS